MFENYYKRNGFSKENSIQWKVWKKKDLLLLANKLIKKKKKLLDPRYAKEHCQSFIRKKNTKSVKQSEIITYQPKTFDTVDIKSVITEHPKTSHILSEAIRRAEKAGCNNSSLYSDTEKYKIF